MTESSSRWRRLRDCVAWWWRLLRRRLRALCWCVDCDMWRPCLCRRPTEWTGDAR